MENYIADINNYIMAEIEILKKLDVDAINTVMNVLESARKNEANIYIMGNGGSAATASHYVCDFNKGISLNLEKKYRLICLNDNIPMLMAIANDIDYNSIFVEQIRGKLNPKDLIIAISGSGNSRNVIEAVNYAKECNVKVIGVTGYDGGIIKQLADYNLHVPINNMQITEDVHMIFDHMMMSILYKRMNK